MAITSSASSLPIAITMGDPAGVGPEILARTLLDGGKDDEARSQKAAIEHIPWILVGAQWALDKGATTLSRALPPLHHIVAPMKLYPAGICSILAFRSLRTSVLVMCSGPAANLL